LIKLNYIEIKALFDKKIFEDGKVDLIEKLSKYPSRYVGLFRPTKPYTKIIQNITQSHEIKFGDAFELLIRKCFELYGYTCLDRNHTLSNDDRVNFDQLFSKNGRVIFIEQKVRDDHDSTKKRGQIDNFEKKLNFLIEKGYKNISSYIYFIDPDLSKNKNYYVAEIEKLKVFYNTKIELCYGDELFEKENMDGLWSDEIISFLRRWRDELPNLPEINFDINPQETFDEIKDLPIPVFRGLFDNEDVVKLIFPIIFPNKTSLKLLLDYFKKQSISNTRQALLYSALSKKLIVAMQAY
jgi:hypothetical protein